MKDAQNYSSVPSSGAALHTAFPDGGRAGQLWSFILVLTERHSTAAGDEQVCVTVQVKNHLDPNFESMTYYPTIYFNEFWMLRDHLIPVNDTVKEVQISLDLSQMPMWKFTIFSQVEKSFEMQVDLLRLLLRRSLHQKL